MNMPWTWKASIDVNCVTSWKSRHKGKIYVTYNKVFLGKTFARYGMWSQSWFNIEFLVVTLSGLCPGHGMDVGSGMIRMFTGAIFHLPPEDSSPVGESYSFIILATTQISDLQVSLGREVVEQP